VTNARSRNLGFFYGRQHFNDGTLTLRNTIVANSFRGNCASFGSSLSATAGEPGHRRHLWERYLLILSRAVA